MSLGTPQYISPEQAMGERSIDARSDLYALGAMCYEMLTGDAPFTGNTVQAIVAKVMTEKPVPLRTVRETVPVHVEQAVLACLAKLPADRPATAKEFGDALAGSGTSMHTTASTPRSPVVCVSRRAPLVAMGLVTIAALSVAVWSRFEASVVQAEPTLQVSIEPPDVAGNIRRRGDYALSPNGQRLVFSMVDTTGRRTLYVRELDSTTARALPGTEGASFPTWSVDSRQIALNCSASVQPQSSVASSSVIALSGRETPPPSGS